MVKCPLLTCARYWLAGEEAEEVRDDRNCEDWVGLPNHSVFCITRKRFLCARDWSISQEY